MHLIILFVGFLEILENGAGGVGLFPEHQGVGGASLGAGGEEIAVFHPLIIQVAVGGGDPLPGHRLHAAALDGDFAAADTLHAKRAPLHNAAGADGHIRIKLVAHSLRPLGFPPVEEPDLVGAVIGAVAGADAAVVDLDVHPFVVVISGVDWADGFAGGVFAVLAHNGDKAGLDVGVLAFPIPLDADPFVGAGLLKGLLGVDRQVVFGLASDDAGLAAGASVQVNHHTPFVVNAFRYHSLYRRSSWYPALTLPLRGRGL